jgi:hypothetical protein
MRLAITSRRQTPAELRIEDVFDAAWRVIGGRQCLLLPPEEAQLQLDLARLLVDLETRGVTDPRELRRLAIEETLLASPGRTSPSRW